MSLISTLQVALLSIPTGRAGGACKRHPPTRCHRGWQTTSRPDHWWVAFRCISKDNGCTGQPPSRCRGKSLTGTGQLSYNLRTNPVRCQSVVWPTKNEFGLAHCSKLWRWPVALVPDAYCTSTCFCPTAAAQISHKASRCIVGQNSRPQPWTRPVRTEVSSSVLPKAIISGASTMSVRSDTATRRPTAPPLSVDSEGLLAFDSLFYWRLTPARFGFIRAGSLPMNYFMISG